MLKSSLLAVLLVLAGAAAPQAQDQTFATWNVGAAWDGVIEARADSFATARAAIDADVYVLQEVMSLASAMEVARLLGLPNADVAVSDFASTADQDEDDDRANVFFHLEVAVISALPIVSVTELEFDREDAAGPLVNDPTIPTGREWLFVPKPVWDNFSAATQGALRFGRGALRVELAGDIVIYAVHAKSDFSNYCANIERATDVLTWIERRSDNESGLPPAQVATLEQAVSVLEGLRAAEEMTSFSEIWLTNAEKREALFTVLADRAADDVAAGKTVMVMGDFNIPIDDPRSGQIMRAEAPEPGMLAGAPNECNPTRSCSAAVEDTLCVGQDGLDESHFIIAGGLIPGFEMTALSADLDETLTGDFSSAVDHIYVAGPRAEQFEPAIVARDSEGNGFGSDHLPVITVLRQ